MQARRRALVPPEIDYELVWLLASLGAIAALTVWFAARLPTPQCAFHALTGLPCLTCGATRAAYQFLQGHFAASFSFNPLAFVTYCAILAFDLYAVLVLLTCAPRVRVTNFSPTEKRFIRVGVLVLLAGNWLYLLAARPV